jgi:ubiquinone/menaquinone biosynthesis C-methylase UbiE
MTGNHKPVDWSDAHYRHMLVQVRQHMWRDDTLEMIAMWLGLRPGMTAADIGCGLGYLGYTFWPYFGKGGTYIGIDVSAKLLDDARKAAEDWSSVGTAMFLNGDACNLPLESNSVDWAMGQTILMHLADPEKGMAEMVRITRPGGMVLSIETDLLSSVLNKPCSSLPEQSIEERLLTFRIHLYSHKGRIELGRGDNNTGVRVPRLMYEQGLVDIDTRLAESVFVLHPPYDTDLMRHRLESVKQRHLDPKHTEHEDSKVKEEFLVGGGDLADFEKYIDLVSRTRDTMAEQIEQGAFYMCGSGDVYIVKGRKPV